MGDVRFDKQLRRLVDAADRAAEIARMTDEEVVQALAATSRAGVSEAYLANVLATEAANRLLRAGLVVESTADAIYGIDLDGRLTFANAAGERLLGVPLAGALGRPVSALVEARDAEGVLLAPSDWPVRRALEERRPVRAERLHMRAASGVPLVVDVHAAPLVVRDDVVGAVVAVRDVSERVRHERRVALLARASTLLGSMLDYHETLQKVAELAVPTFADWCAVHLDQDGRIEPVTIAHADPAKVTLARAYQQRYPPDRDAPHGAARVIRTGEPELLEELTDEILRRAAAGDEERLRALRELGMRSAVIAPMVARGRILGAVTLVWGESGHRYDAADLETARELAARAAFAIDNARLHAAAEAANRLARDMLDAGADGMYGLDADGRATFANAAAERLLGWSADDLLGKSLHRLIHNRRADGSPYPEEECPVHRTIREATVQHGFGEVFWRKDGTSFRVTFTSRPILVDGAVRGAFVTFRDATEGDPELYRTLVETAHDYAIYALDVDGRVRSWNEGARRLKGWTREAVLGQHFRMFFPRDAAARGDPEDELSQALARGRIEREGWRVRKDGSRFWANVVLTALKDADGGHVGYAKITRDLTERKRHEDELAAAVAKLQASEERLRLMIESVREYAIFMLDPDGRVASWNQGAERVKGYRAGEIVGRHFRAFYTPEDIARGHPEDVLAAADARGSYEEEAWRVRKDGARFWASVVVTALRDRDGHLRGFVKVVRDITDRKRHEEELERRVAERTRLLAQTNAQLEAFNATVSHDVRAPMRAAEAYSQAILQDYGETLPKEARELVVRLHAEARAATALVNDLLEFSRAGHGAVHRDRVDVSALVSEILEGLRRREPRRTVQATVQPGLVAFADRALLSVAVENLIANAWKFTARRDDACIDVGQVEDGSFFVRDNGVGFETEHAPELFQPFRRLHSRAEFPGTGVGLATVRRVIEQHGGRVWADSAPEQGATFWFTLPDPEPSRD